MAKLKLLSKVRHLFLIKKCRDRCLKVKQINYRFSSSSKQLVPHPVDKRQLITKPWDSIFNYLWKDFCRCVEKNRSNFGYDLGLN